jgi:chromosome partitioning protein
MRSIAIINQKGGVGKTTTAVNVSAALARAGRQVLLIDLDPQAHATLHLGIELSPEDKSTYDVVVGGVPLEAATREVAERLTAVPAHVDLVGAEVELANRSERELILARALEEYRDPYDFLVIDGGPSLGVLTINALAAAQEVIIPLQPHYLALEGLGKLLETVSLVRGVLKPGLRVSGVVLCMYETNTRLAQEVRSDVSQFIRDAEFQDAWYGARVFATCIRRNIKLAECPSFGKTIFDYAPRCRGAADYAALVGEILAMEQPEQAEPAVASKEERAPSEAEVDGQQGRVLAGPISKPEEAVAAGGTEFGLNPYTGLAADTTVDPPAAGETRPAIAPSGEPGDGRPHSASTP